MSILSSRFATGVMLIFVIIELQLIAMLALHMITCIIDFLVLTNLAIINTLKLLNLFFAENGRDQEVGLI